MSCKITGEQQAWKHHQEQISDLRRSQKLRTREQNLRSKLRSLSVHCATYPLVFLRLDGTFFVLVMVGGMQQFPRVELRHHAGPLREKLQTSKSKIRCISIFLVCARFFVCRYNLKQTRHRLTLPEKNVK